MPFQWPSEPELELEFTIDRFQIGEIIPEDQLPPETMGRRCPLELRSFYEQATKRLYLTLIASLARAAETNKIEYRHPATWWDFWKQDHPKAARFLRLAPPRMKENVWEIREVYPNLRAKLGEQYIKVQMIQRVEAIK